MKKIIIIILVIIVVVFFFPKKVVVGGWLQPDLLPGMKNSEYKCFGISKYVPVNDATILYCFGIPYETEVEFDAPEE